MPTVEELDESINRRLANLNFWEFCLYYDNAFFTRRPFLKHVAGKFQWLYDEYIDGRSRRISVSMPPRAGKSYITSLFCAWWIGKLPELCIMRNSCTATLYKKLSRHVRNMIEDPRYKRVFPKIKLSDDNQALENWSVTAARNGSYYGGGVGTNIIGNGANLAINDDLYPGITHALSPGYNEKVIEWKEGTADSRKESGCPELYIGTRWRKGDIIGKAIDDGKIDMEISIAALNEQGRSFCEDVRTTEEYLETMNDIDEAIWMAEYMQQPIDLKGLLFPKSELHYYNPATVDVEKLAEYRFTFIDPADEGGDDLSAPVGYLIGDKIYIVDVIYNNEGTDVNEPGCVDLINRHKCDAAEIESNSAWILFRKAVKAALERMGNYCDIRSIKNTTNKHTRILAQSAFIKHNFVFREDWRQLPQYRKFFENLTSYMRMDSGKSAHDDAPDSCAGMAKYFRNHFTRLWQLVSNAA